MPVRLEEARYNVLDQLTDEPTTLTRLAASEFATILGTQIFSEEFTDGVPNPDSYVAFFRPSRPIKTFQVSASAVDNVTKKPLATPIPSSHDPNSMILANLKKAAWRRHNDDDQGIGDGANVRWFKGHKNPFLGDQLQAGEPSTLSKHTWIGDTYELRHTAENETGEPGVEVDIRLYACDSLKWRELEPCNEEDQMTRRLDQETAGSSLASSTPSGPVKSSTRSLISTGCGTAYETKPGSSVGPINGRSAYHSSPLGSGTVYI